jgi:lipopolysaccharide/colanic/teichoic acid biosynthesis glycosyltransferase
VNTSNETQQMGTLISPQDIGNTVYPTDFFQARLKEEFLRTNRTQKPFLYIKVVTRQFDLVGFAKPDNAAIRAWKIAVLTLFTETKFTDVVGYLNDENGLGVISLDSDISRLEQLRKQILRNISRAGLINQLRKKTKRPIFEISVYTGLLEKQDQELDIAIAHFNEANEGFFSLSRLFYSDVIGEGTSRRWMSPLKRIFDFSAAFCSILFLSPLLIACAIAVKVSDPQGPVIFKQVRVGKNGKTFVMYKFRSMYADAEKRKKDLEEFNESNGPTFKMKNDPRIYPFGRIFRKFSLDELPQLFNILIGNMSIVGPRPPLPSEVEEYLPWHKMRLSVTPGLTCFWQVSGRSEIGFEDWMRLDNQYVRHGNLGTDAQLVAKTFKVVFKGDGAY